MAAKTFLYSLDNDDDLSWPLSVFQAFFNIDDQRSTEHMNWWQKVGFFSWSCKKLTGWTLNLKFLDCSLNIHLLHILSLRNYVDFIYFAAGRRGANLGYCRSPGGQLRHVPVGAVRHSLRRHQEVPARLLRELLQRGPHQDPAHQRGQGALPPRQPSGRRHREFRTVLLINCQPLIVSVPFRLLKLYYFDCSKFVKLFRVEANWGQHLEHWPPPVIMPYDALNTLQRIFFWRLFTLHCIR